jgi:hypothetical protein
VYDSFHQQPTTEETMNVYQRLNAAREAFHSQELRKSGHNKFAGYQYFELGDFVVPALAIFKHVGLTSVISFGADQAVMRIVNTEKPEDFIEITSPMSEANLKGCHPVQNLGAVQTYTRRYLWVAALEIVEHDAIDSNEPVKQEPKHEPVPMISAEQAIEIDELIESTKSDRAGLLNWVSKNTNTNCADVSMIPNVAYVHVKKMLTKKAEKVAA